MGISLTSRKFILNKAAVLAFIYQSVVALPASAAAPSGIRYFGSESVQLSESGSFQITGRHFHAHGSHQEFSAPLRMREQIWIAISTKPKASQRFLKISETNVVQFEVFFLDRKGHPLAHVASDQNRNLPDEIVGIPVPDVALDSILIKATIQGHVIFNPSYVSERGTGTYFKKSVIKAGFIAVMLNFMLLAAVGFILYRYHFFLWFSLSAFGFAACLVENSGFGQLFLWGFDSRFDRSSFAFINSFTAGLFFIFIRSFLHGQPLSNWLKRLLSATAIYSLVVAVLSLFMPSRIVFLVPGCGALAIICTFFMVAQLRHSTERYIKLYIYSWPVFMAFVLLYLFDIFGLVNNFPLQGLEIHIGAVSDSTFLFCASVLQARTIIRGNEEKSKKLEELVQHNSKLASMGIMAGGIAHEINNPLGIIKSQISNVTFLLNSSMPDIPNALKFLRSADNTVERIANIVRSLRVLGDNKSQVIMQRANLKGIVDEVLRLPIARVNRQEVELVGDLGAIDIMVNPGQLSQILINLIQNAFDATRDTTNRWIRVSAEQGADGVRISVSNSGPSINPAIVKQLFDPFFTTKDVGSGLGLGLSLSKALAEANQGDLFVDEAAVNPTFVLKLLSYKRAA